MKQIFISKINTLSAFLSIGLLLGTASHAMQEIPNEGGTAAAQTHEDISLENKMCATLEYAMIHHNEILVREGMPRPGSSFSNFILKHAYTILTTMANTQGWSNVGIKTHLEFTEKIKPLHGFLIIPESKTTGYQGWSECQTTMIHFMHALNNLPVLMQKTLTDIGQTPYVHDVTNELMNITRHDLFPRTHIDGIPEYHHLENHVVVIHNDHIHDVVDAISHNNQGHEILVNAIRTNEPVVVRLALASGIIPHVTDMALARLLLVPDSVETRCTRKKTKKIGLLLLQNLRLHTQCSDISKQGIIGIGRLPQELVQHIARFQDIRDAHNTRNNQLQELLTIPLPINLRSLVTMMDRLHTLETTIRRLHQPPTIIGGIGVIQQYIELMSAVMHLVEAFEPEPQEPTEFEEVDTLT